MCLDWFLARCSSYTTVQVQFGMMRDASSDDDDDVVLDGTFLIFYSYI